MLPQELWKLKSHMFQPCCSAFATTSLPKCPPFPQRRSSSTAGVCGRSATSNQPRFLTTGRGCLLSSSLTQTWLMVDVPYVCTDQLLQCCTLMQPLEEQQREDVLVKQMQQGEKSVCLKFISSHPHITHCYLNQASLGPELLSTEERELKPKVWPAFQSSNP